MRTPGDRRPAGIAGLDSILGDDVVFRDGISIIQSAPGAGKSILGNQFSSAHAVGE